MSFFVISFVVTFYYVRKLSNFAHTKVYKNHENQAGNS